MDRIKDREMHNPAIKTEDRIKDRIADRRKQARTGEQAHGEIQGSIENKIMEITVMKATRNDRQWMWKKTSMR